MEKAAKKRMTRLILFITLGLISCSSGISKEKISEPVVLAYVTSWNEDIPDPTYITHINYSFGHVNDEFNGVRIDNEDRLKLMVGLKEKKPELKVLLSIGGWGSGRFSEMAADEANRKAFSVDCQRIVDQFDLDGIDLDWEYPTSSLAKISSSPDDTNNFTLLVRDIRKEIGNDKLLTFASAANAEYVDFKAVEPYLDFINIMTYDMNKPGNDPYPYHNAGLYRSEHTWDLSVDEAVVAHIEAGIPPQKLTLGIPFGGKGIRGVRFSNIHLQTDYTQEWDDLAKAAYLADADGKFVHTYEEPRAIAYKCEYLHSKGLLGAMYWQYSSDDSIGTLRKAVYDGVMRAK
jgi:chitinase